MTMTVYISTGIAISLRNKEHVIRLLKKISTMKSNSKDIMSIFPAYLSWSFDSCGMSSLIFAPSLVTTIVTTGLFCSFGKHVVNFAHFT